MEVLIVDPVHVIVISDEEVSEREEHESDEETVTMGVKSDTEGEPNKQSEAENNDVVREEESDINCDETKMVSVI